MQFLIIASGYNCQKRVKKCIDSVKAQTYNKFQAVFISDGSTDATGNFLGQQRGLNSRFYFEIHNDNTGAAKRRFDAIKKYCENDETVVLLLGLDDELKPNCLSKIKEEYDKGAWCTYGNWENQLKEMLPDGFIHFSESIHKTRDYRKSTYRSTAPNTFKKFLFNEMKESDFMFQGEWIKATTESNLMISCLEMSGKEKIGVIAEPIYIYNQGRQDNARRRFGNQYQDSIYNDVRNKPKRDLLCR